MLSNSQDWLVALGRASLTLAISAVAVQGTLWLLRIKSARAHRLAWICVLLQGVILFRITVSIPSNEAVVATKLTSAANLETKEPSFVVPTLQEPKSQETATDLSGTSTTAEYRTASLNEVNAPSLIGWQVGMWIWFMGTTVLTGGWLASYCYFARRLKLKPTGIRWEQEWLEMLANAGISKAIPLRMTHGVGPALCMLPSGYHVLVPERFWRKLAVEERGAVLSP